jgi:DNA anti-recombination protein RmuC
MKYLAAIVCLGFIGFAQAQSTSRDVEIYERYENGELVEQRQSATENGVPIKNFDFEKAKREMQLKSAGLEQKMGEMQSRMELKLQEMEGKMKLKRQEMEQRMSDFEKRSEEMHKKMDQRMKEMDSKDKELKESPSEVEKPAVGESTQNVKFT